MEIVANGGITSAEGFLAGAVYCGIKRQQVPDLVLIYSTRPCVLGTAFTKNELKSEALLLAREHSRSGRAQAIIVNSGNANACTGKEGREAALEMARLAAAKLDVAPGDVLIASTGVIGKRLPIEKIRAGIREIALTREGGHAAAIGITTTDRGPKEAAVRIEVAGHRVTLGGIAKGAGMIHPDMATMFAFITTDAAIEGPFLQELTRQAVDRSFNAIDIDGDTSPSDTVAVLANALAGNPTLRPGSEGSEAFVRALDYVCQTLAKAIVMDGEGATKLIEVRVKGAATNHDARLAARGVASSNLVKAAVYGSDPNWGRILNAVGYSGARLDQHRADIAIGGVALMVAGEIAGFDPESASNALRSPNVFVDVDLHLGEGEAIAWGCDLTEEYVRFNAKYTT